MSEQTAGLYTEPGPDMIDKYVQLADGKWYPRDSAGVNSVSGRINPDGSVEIFDEVAVGDLNSDAKGSGARKNSNKPALELIPVRVWLEIFAGTPLAKGWPDLIASLGDLANFQENNGLASEALLSQGSQAWIDCANVFTYGANKYAEWNWLKGMPWSVPLACALRHAFAILMRGETIDDESGLPHIGHYLCNIVMLATYEETYKEGDDRPPKEYFDAG